MQEAAPNHLRHIRCARDPDPEILLVKLVNDLFQTPDEQFVAPGWDEHHHIAGPSIFGDQQASSKNGLFSASAKSFGPSVRLRTPVTDLMDSMRACGPAPRAA